jgi:hypothetical protein
MRSYERLFIESQIAERKVAESHAVKMDKNNSKSNAIFTYCQIVNSIWMDSGLSYTPKVVGKKECYSMTV